MQIDPLVWSNGDREREFRERSERTFMNKIMEVIKAKGTKAIKRRGEKKNDYSWRPLRHLGHVSGRPLRHLGHVGGRHDIHDIIHDVHYVNLFTSSHVQCFFFFFIFFFFFFSCIGRTKVKEIPGLPGPNLVCCFPFSFFRFSFFFSWKREENDLLLFCAKE